MKKDLRNLIIGIIIGIMIAVVIIGVIALINDSSYNEITQGQLNDNKTSTFEVDNVKFGNYGTEGWWLNEYNPCMKEFERTHNELEYLSCYMTYASPKEFECEIDYNPLIEECVYYNCHTDLIVGCVCKYKEK